MDSCYAAEKKQEGKKNIFIARISGYIIIYKNWQKKQETFSAIMVHVQPKPIIQREKTGK